MHDRLHALLRQVLRLSAGFAGQGMLDDHYRVRGQPQGLSPEAGRLGKRLGDDGDRGAAPLFGFDPVVETPRGAGPSIGHRVDDHLAFVGQLIQHLTGYRQTLADLPVGDHAGHTVPFLQ